MAGAALIVAAVALAGTEQQRVVLHVSFGDLTPERVVATVQQAGATREVPLVDDGSDIHDARGDRVYTGSVTGTPAQYLPVRLAVDVDGVRQDVYSGTVRVGMERTAELAFEVTTDSRGELVGARRASASPGRVSHATEAVPLVAGAFWAVFVLAWGAIALRLGRSSPGEG